MNTELPTQPETRKTSVRPSLDDPDFWDKASEITVENLNQMMEEMANAPKEPIGKRQPGERGMYEIQRREDYSLRTGKNINGGFLES